MTNDLHEKLLSRKFKQNYQPPDENIIFTIDGKNICLGTYDTPQEAHQVFLVELNKRLIN
jgi:hypothetical protein